MKLTYEEFVHCAECDTSGRYILRIEFSHAGIIYLCQECLDALRDMLSEGVR